MGPENAREAMLALSERKIVRVDRWEWQLIHGGVECRDASMDEGRWFPSSLANFVFAIAEAAYAAGVASGAQEAVSRAIAGE